MILLSTVVVVLGVVGILSIIWGLVGFLGEFTMPEKYPMTFWYTSMNILHIAAGGVLIGIALRLLP